MTAREILEQVKERIMAIPESYTQTDFCGTKCCIAGHIDSIINGVDIHNARPRTSETIELVPFIAALALDDVPNMWLFGSVRTSDELDEDEDDELDPNYWPPDLSEEYRGANNAGRARIGCKAIDRYIAERGL